MRELSAAFDAKAFQREVNRAIAFQGGPGPLRVEEHQKITALIGPPIVGESLATVLDAVLSGVAPLPSLDLALAVTMGVAARLGKGGPRHIHGDLAPHHIIIGYDGSISLIDPAGPEDALERGKAPGRESYRSPEHVRAEGLSPASDVFVLGILLFELTTGTRLYSGAKPQDIDALIVEGGYPRPRSVIGDHYPIELQVLLRKLLRPQPEARYFDGEAALEGLRLAGSGQSAERTQKLGEWLRAQFRDRYSAWARVLREHGIELPEADIDVDAEPTEAPALDPFPSFKPPSAPPLGPPKGALPSPSGPPPSALRGVGPATATIREAQRVTSQMPRIEAEEEDPDESTRPVLSAPPTPGDRAQTSPDRAAPQRFATRVDSRPPVIDEAKVVEPRGPTKVDSRPPITAVMVKRPHEKEEITWIDDVVRPSAGENAFSRASTALDTPLPAPLFGSSPFAPADVAQQPPALAPGFAPSSRMAPDTVEAALEGNDALSLPSLDVLEELRMAARTALEMPPGNLDPFADKIAPDARSFEPKMDRALVSMRIEEKAKKLSADLLDGLKAAESEEGPALLDDGAFELVAGAEAGSEALTPAPILGEAPRLPFDIASDLIADTAPPGATVPRGAGARTPPPSTGESAQIPGPRKVKARTESVMGSESATLTDADPPFPRPAARVPLASPPTAPRPSEPKTEAKPKHKASPSSPAEPAGVIPSADFSDDGKGSKEIRREATVIVRQRVIPRDSVKHEVDLLLPVGPKSLGLEESDSGPTMIPHPPEPEDTDSEVELVVPVPEEEGKKRPSKGSKTWVALVIIAAVLAALAGLMWMFGPGGGAAMIVVPTRQVDEPPPIAAIPAPSPSETAAATSTSSALGAGGATPEAASATTAASPEPEPEVIEPEPETPEAAVAPAVSEAPEAAAAPAVSEAPEPEPSPSPSPKDTRPNPRAKKPVTVPAAKPTTEIKVSAFPVTAKISIGDVEIENGGRVVLHGEPVTVRVSADGYVEQRVVLKPGSKKEIAIVLRPKK